VELSQSKVQLGTVDPLSIEDTVVGTHLTVLYGNVSLIQREICTQLYLVGTADNALIREVSFFRAPFIERFHCTLYTYVCLINMCVVGMLCVHVCDSVRL